MGRPGVGGAVRWAFCTASLILAGAPHLRASGVAIVSRKGVQAYTAAKAGFLQSAYSLQIQGLNPKAVDLDGTAADDALLAGLRAQAPDLVFAVGSHAAKKARQNFPGAWIVYSMVFYPEVEGFLQDPKMIGISSMGPTKGLAQMLKAIGKGKSVVVLHASALAPSIPDLLARLKSDGLEGRAISVGGADDLQGIFSGLKGLADTVLLLPDPITSNPDAMRFIITQCISSGILPVSLSDSLVSNGALCAAFFPPEDVGNQGARVAKEILAGTPPSSKVVTPSGSSTSLNQGTAAGLRLKLPKNFRAEVIYE